MAIFFVCRELQVRLSDNKVISSNRQKISQINLDKKAKHSCTRKSNKFNNLGKLLNVITLKPHICGHFIRMITLTAYFCAEINRNYILGKLKKG